MSEWLHTCSKILCREKILCDIKLMAFEIFQLLKIIFLCVIMKATELEEGELFIMRFTLTQGFTYIYCTCLNCFLLFENFLTVITWINLQEIFSCIEIEGLKRILIFLELVDLNLMWKSKKNFKAFFVNIYQFFKHLLPF